MKEESSFLSSPETSFKIHAILEQLYEDLNSYSETSIQIDKFNSIELKIFPFYPNPPPVKDWMVPVALIKFDNINIMGQNWDLTMAKVRSFHPRGFECGQLLGLQIHRWHQPHSSDRTPCRLRYRADSPGHITSVVRKFSFFSWSNDVIHPMPRYYQVVMTIDIFQYSNMYTLRKSIQWLADEPHVKDECGPYVIKEGMACHHLSVIFT